MPDSIHSAIYTGWVRHRRFLPVAHSFRYRIFMMYLDLDELPGLFRDRWLWSAMRRNLAWFRRADYLGDAGKPLKQAVSDLLAQETGHAARGPIRLLTNMRYFGYCFNPVSFYYCFEADGTTLQAIVSDINNTPWGERHAYVLDCSKKSAPPAAEHAALQRFQFSKDFHVSPFMPMNIEYDWAFGQPKQQLSVHMRNLMADGRMFDATLQLARQPLNGRALAWVLLAYPLMTFKVILAIYWQALRLWLKGAHFFGHPAQAEPMQPASQHQPKNHPKPQGTPR